MSGTSLDGIDAVIADFSSNRPNLVASYSHAFPDTVKQELLNIIQPDWQGSLLQLGTLDQTLGKLFSEAVNQLLELASVNKNQISAIGSHGHTLWHQPTGEHPFSLQLGNANRIAELTAITTIADFRGRDIAAGGQGAPLVPAFHAEFLTHSTRNRIVLNIGGIANVTSLPSSDNDVDQISGFDTGPGNGLIDAWIEAHKNKPYDKSGQWARSGKVLPNLLEHLLDEPYFSAPHPKSTGKEYFNLHWLRNKLSGGFSSCNPKDVQATITALTAYTIAKNCNKCDEVLVCGGGVHNEYLIELLAEYLISTPTLSSTASAGIDPDWMEAIAFAWLAKQTLEKKTANLPAVTGAKGSRILGAIYQ